MKTQKILLDIDDEDEEITIGLIRLVKEVPAHELFFHLNSLNTFKFSRIEDFILRGNYYHHYYPRFESFHCESRIKIHIIANKSCDYIQKKVSTELFTEEGENRFLLPNSPDVDYIIKTSEPFDDFSVILHPENLMFKIQDFVLSSDEELYQNIQYYE